MNENFKIKYSKLVDFLGKTLGENYEIVLHDINENGSSIAAISNSHISGRSINSPLTGFALELLQSKKYLESDYVTHYKAKTNSNTKINGSTFFIKEDNNIVGMLCINHDTSKLERLSSEIMRLANANNDETLQLDPIEQLSESIEELMQTILDKYNLDVNDAKPKNRAKCIQKLYENGIFNIKGSIPKVAKFLNLSEPSIYRYLQKLQG